jgi:phage/plasmid-like protein (TIGR03299 family)
MAHNLEIVDGVAQIAYAGETPWHNLGKKVPHDLTPEQMCKAAGLDWEVEKEAAFLPLNGKKHLSRAGFLVRKANGRNIKEDSILTHLPNMSTWHEYQNAAGFAFFNEFIATGNMHMDVAGALGNGSIVWSLAKFTESFSILRKDEINSYLLFVLSHKHGTAHSVLLTPVRAVCNNTISMALAQSAKTGAKLTVSHRNPFDPETVKEKLGLAKAKMSKYQEEATFLARTKYKNEDIVEYFTKVFPVNASKKKEGSTRKPKELHRGAAYSMALLDTQPGADIFPGTFWNLYNAATYYTNHLAGKTDDGRVRSLWLGDSAKTNDDALEIALEMAKAA